MIGRNFDQESPDSAEQGVRRKARSGNRKYRVTETIWVAPVETTKPLGTCYKRVYPGRSEGQSSPLQS